MNQPLFILAMALCAAGVGAIALAFVALARKETWRAQEVVVIDRMKRGLLSEAFVAPLLTRFPKSLPINAAWCALALDQGLASPELQNRLVHYRTLFPKDEFGCVHYALWLSHQNRHDEAEAVLRAGRRRSPPMPLQTVTWIYRVHQDYALAAERRKDWPAAFQRWRDIQRRFPTQPDGWIGEARAQFQAGDIPRARQTLQPALALNPKDHRSLRLDAEIAEHTEDWPAAVQSWERFRLHHDSAPEGYLRGATACIRAGETCAGSDLLDRVAYLFPKDERTMAERERILGMVPEAACP